MSSEEKYQLELRAIRKAFPAVVANDGIDLRVRAGEIHAVLGENGAGKSTLMKIIYGVLQPDAGGVLWEGQPVSIHSPARARDLGIGMVFQHFSLFETLTVAENIALGIRTSKSDLALRIVELSHRYQLPVDPHQLVHDLSVGERQRVEIVRALLQSPKLLILDEPTSVLDPRAVEGLFATLRQLASEGCAVLYISHKLEEIQRLCHRATVLRNGKVVGTADPRHESAQSLARMMIGHDIERPLRHTYAGGHEKRLEVRNLSHRDTADTGTALHDITFTVHAGEIVGIAGISGNGQQELLRALSGEITMVDADAVRLNGTSVAHLDAGARRALGLCFVPEERLGRGAVPAMTLGENALLTGHHQGMIRQGWIKFGRARQLARRCIEEMKVKAVGEQALAASLSGGNLQKFIVGRELLQSPKVLLVSQPTWGVDVGAATELRQRLLDLRDTGVALLVISEDLEELFEVCDRIGVLFHGRLTPLVPLTATRTEEIGGWMAGLHPAFGTAAHATV